MIERSVITLLFASVIRGEGSEVKGVIQGAMVGAGAVLAIFWPKDGE